MVQEKAFKTLESLGLSSYATQVYVLLGKHGPQTAREIGKALKRPKQQLYVILKSMQSKGIVSSSLERPAKFSAVPFERVLDLVVNAKMEEAQRIKQNKMEILNDWQLVSSEETKGHSAKFAVFEGRNYIYSKIKQMIEETETQLQVISTVPGLARADQFGVWDAVFSQLSKSKIRFRFLLEVSEQNKVFLEQLLKRALRQKIQFEGRALDLGLKPFPRMVIRDKEEILFFIAPRSAQFVTEQDDTCLWTNCDSLVQAFKVVFDDLWSSSTVIEKRIIEFGAPDSATGTRIFVDPGAGANEYREAMNRAEKEIIIVTSVERLVNYENERLLEKIARENVSIKLMAPLTGQNFAAAQRLSKYCEIRHIPPGCTDTTLIDGHHLFQFKPELIEKDDQSDLEAYYRETCYTNNLESIQRTKNMINEIWQKAYAPLLFKPEKPSPPPSPASSVDEKRSKAYGKVFNFLEEPNIPNDISEKEILNKIINAKRNTHKKWRRDGVQIYGSLAQAFINLPKSFNLPNFMVQVYCNNAQSTFGAGAHINFFVLTISPQQPSYVSAGAICSNPQLASLLKVVRAGTPAEKSVHLVKKNELEVRLQGNTMFAGWTKPISLTPNLVMPPCCILFDGYGEVKTNRVKIDYLNGWRLWHEGNSFEAFTTFLHPSSKFSVPGTDGLFFRDSILNYVAPVGQKPRP